MTERVERGENIVNFKNLEGIEKNLATLEPLVYETQRATLSEQFGFRLSVLDDMYKGARNQHNIGVARDVTTKIRNDASQGIEKLGIKSLAVPEPYILDETGVSVLTLSNGDLEPEQIFIARQPLWVAANTRDRDGNNCGLLVKWIDGDNTHREWAIQSQLLHEPKEVAKILANMGASIVPGKELEICRYISAFKCEVRLRSATQTGWHGDAFVFPGEIINPSSQEEIIFQPTEYHASFDSLFPSGSLKEWQNGVAKPIENIDLAAFAVAVGFATPFAVMAGVENGGIHFYGTTSRGKTTLLQMVASLYGNGVDPNKSHGCTPYIQTWNTTKNSLEGVLVGFNAVPACIDEIGSSDTSRFRETNLQCILWNG